MDELKNFTGGGMDVDSAPELVAANDYRNAYNIRNVGTQEGEHGYITNLESMHPIDATRPAGLNKTVGSAAFETTRKIFAFHYNSQNYHQIAEIDYDTDEETVIFTNITDSGGEDILKLDPNQRICDIKLINDQFLVFTDGLDQLCYIDYQKLKAGEYGVVTLDDLSLIKAQPLKIPKAVFANDSTRSTNTLSKKLFQFAYFYTYEQYEESTLSSYSKRLIPTQESTPTIGTDVTKSNTLLITVNAGGNRVKTINVAARYDNLDWFVIASVERDKVLTLPSAIDLGLFVREAYNATTNEYTFAFYNDGLFTNLDVLFTDLPYDFVPQKAGALEVLNNNTLALADLTEGYNRPVVDATFSATSYDPGIRQPAADTTDDLKLEFTIADVTGGDNPYEKIDVTFRGLPKTGDKISFVMASVDGDVYNTYTYQVPLSQNNNLWEVAKSVGANMPYPYSVRYYYSPFTGVDTSRVILRFSARRVSDTPDGKRETMKNYVLDLNNSGTGTSTSLHALKLNSSYQLALAHYDKYGRYFPIATDTSFVLKTQSYAQTKGNTPIINWALNSTPPEDAVSYQWLISPNNTHQSTLYTVGVIDNDLSTNDYLVFKINSLKKFNETNSSSVLNYEYSEGDRVTFNYYHDGDVNIAWFENPAVDVEVVDFEIKTDTTPDPDVTNFLLKVRKPSSVSTDTLNGKNVLLEIYTPKKRTETVNNEVQYASTVFYEIGEQFLIEDGQYTVTSGTITDGDVYYKSREMPRSTDTNESYQYVVEDFNFSDYYKSNYYSFGRQRTYFDTPERTRNKASIRYSDPLIVGSKSNGLTRFYKERVYGDLAGETSSNYGAITKMYMRDNYLICLQELKVGHIPVNISILEDQASTTNVAISTKLLNYVRYAQGKWGIGKSKESFSVSKNGDIYFIDPNNSLPIRDGANGVNPISFKMSKYFLKTLQKAYKEGRKMIGTFDDYNNEYRLFIEGVGDTLTSIVFSASNFDYLEPYTVVASSLALSGSPSNGGVSINTTTGKAVFTPTTGYTGNAGFAFSFTNNIGVPITKNACITVEAGDKTPDSFTFGDLIDQSQSTLIESNAILINGINIPTSISITGGQYQINGGAWVSTTGFVNNGDTVKVRQTSSGSGGVTTNTVLTVGTYSDTFSVTTISGGESAKELIEIDIYGEPNTTNLLLDLTDIPSIGTTELAYTGSNFVLAADAATPNNCWLLASDYIPQVTLRWRFIINLTPLLADNPLINSFPIKLRGRAVSAGTLSGAYVVYFGGSSANMDISSGYYQPYHTGGTASTSGAILVGIGDGADGVYDNTLPVLQTYTYDRITKLVTIT